MISKVESKSSELVSIFHAHSGMNLARVKFFVLFISALCKVQTVGLGKLASAFDSRADTASSLRRIQRFMVYYLPDTDLIVRLIFRLLPLQPPYRLAMDRTNWKFGKANINVLVLAVVYQGVAFPLLFKMLPRFGNSHTNERIQLIQRFIRLFDKHRSENSSKKQNLWMIYLINNLF